MEERSPVKISMNSTMDKRRNIRRRVHRNEDSDDGKVGISPDKDRGQATDKYDKTRIPAKKIDGKAEKPRKPKRVVDDEGEEIPDEMLPLLDDEVEFMKEFIKE